MDELDDLIRKRINEKHANDGFKSLLAKKLKVDRSYVSHWLAGRRSFGDLDRKIAMQLLGVSEWELREGR